MSDPNAGRVRVLAVYPFSKGLAFCALEQPLRWINSGTKRLDRHDAHQTWSVVGGLLEKHDIDVLVLERDAVATRSEASLRCAANLIRLARQAGVGTSLITEAEVRAALGVGMEAHRHQVNECLGVAFPQIRAQQPRRRRLWESETEGAKVFRAVGLAVGALYAPSRKL